MIFALLDSADDSISPVELVHHPLEILRIVLEIGVEDRDPFAIANGESCLDSCGFAHILLMPNELQEIEPSRKLEDTISSSVGRSIVDDDYLRPKMLLRQELVEFQHKRFDVIDLVICRHDHRKRVVRRHFFSVSVSVIILSHFLTRS